MIKVINGNSIEELKKFPNNYFGSVVTDPPYGLSFMGKKWDYDVPSVELWKEVFRVLKEGGHLLAFAGTRTQHRMAVNIEDAGFEIRDMIAWVYGSGFPKSHNIGKAIDKINAKSFEKCLEFTEHLLSKKGNYTNRDIDEILGLNNGAFHFFAKSQSNHALPSKKHYDKLKKLLNLSDEWDWFIEEAEREIVGKKEKQMQGWSMDGKTKFVDRDITLPKTDEAKQWEGWGTALKPALEPITVARKPFKTSVAENVLKNGVGGINIDGCRVELQNGDKKTSGGCKGTENAVSYNFGKPNKEDNTKGRFPANFIHDGSDEVKDLFPYSKSGGGDKGQKNSKAFFGNMGGQYNSKEYNANSGNASRFFYCAKASKQDREENNNHPTVKPTDLMRYLVRLVTPKNEIVLDCFMGSGSTGKACALEGLSFVGIDLDKDYCKIAKARIDKALEDKRIMDSQTKLF